MSSSSLNSRMAARRSHSLTRRWTSGRDTRRRSGRGGKTGPRPAAHLSLLPLPPFQPDQSAVAQPHCNRLPVKALPAPPRILLPAQLRFRFFLILPHPVATMGILDPYGPRRRDRAVTPAIFPVPVLTAPGAVPDQPAAVAGALPLHPPAAPRAKLRSPPSFHPFAARDFAFHLSRLRSKNLTSFRLGLV